jgi:hypothetical protein
MKTVARLLVATIACTLNVCASITDQSEPTKDCRVVISKDLVDSKAPNFEAYALKKSETVTNPKVDIQSAEFGKAFRTVLIRAAKRGPNFAGHYRVVVWGCGSSCSSFAVVNLITGRILATEAPAAINGVEFEVGDFMSKTDSDDTSFRYRKNSKLLVVLGADNENSDRAGAFYFTLDDEHLKLVHFTRVVKQCAER